MESDLQRPALVAANTTPKGQLHRLLDRHWALLPADELHRLRATNPAAGGGSLHSIGVVLILAPVPARLKEWAYAGFAVNLASALIAHLSVGDGWQAWGWPAGTGVLWALSYFFWRSGGYCITKSVIQYPG
jgi:hypothetical protein